MEITKTLTVNQTIGKEIYTENKPTSQYCGDMLQLYLQSHTKLTICEVGTL